MSVDQMQSMVPGMVGQLKGVPTVPFCYCVRQPVQWVELHSFKKTSLGEETLDAKMAFEGFTRLLNV
jgi:hypothetical protein